MYIYVLLEPSRKYAYRYVTLTICITQGANLEVEMVRDDMTYDTWRGHWAMTAFCTDRPTGMLLKENIKTSKEWIRRAKCSWCWKTTPRGKPYLTGYACTRFCLLLAIEICNFNFTVFRIVVVMHGISLAEPNFNHFIRFSGFYLFLIGLITLDVSCNFSPWKISSHFIFHQDVDSICIGTCNVITWHWRGRTLCCGPVWTICLTREICPSW